MKEKSQWKEQSGNRYTPVELQEMAQTTRVIIKKRKRIVMRHVPKAVSP